MSKKILISALIFFWFGLSAAFAQNENIMILHDVTADAGEVITVELEIQNDDEFVGFNLDIPFPDGFTYVDGSAQLFRKTDHVFYFSMNPQNVAKIIAFSINLNPFTGNEGVILSFEVQTPNVPGDYLFEIVDPIIGDINAQDILTGTVDATITLEGDEPDPGFNLTLVANPAEGGTLTGEGEYPEGTDVAVGAVANTGFTFINWTDAGGNEVSADASFIYTMPAADVELTANFDEDEDPDPVYTLSLLANPTDGGTLTGAGDYTEGTDVNVSAITNEGFTFINWTDTGGLEVSADAAFVYTMPGNDVVLTANFEEDDTPEPDPENIIKIHDITANPGDLVTIEVEILNDEAFVGFNLDIPLPEGASYVEGSAQLFRETDHMFVFNVIEETNLAKIVAFSISNAEFIGNDGVIFSFDIITPNVPGEYPLEVVNGIIGNIEAEDITTGTIDGMLTLVGVENIMKVHDIEADAGEIITVEIEILNDQEFVGFNADIPIPEGFEYVDGSAQLFRGDDHQFGFNVTAAGVAKIIAFSISNAAFEGNEGVVFSFDLTTPGFAGEFPLHLQEAVIGDVNAQNILTGTIDGTVYLEGEALPENIIKILDITAEAGDIVTIEVEILNDEEFVGFNLDIPLPEGFEYIDGTAQLFREDDHMFVFNVIEDTNLAKIVAFSISNAAFIGNDGVIFSFDVQTPNVPGEYPLEVVNGIIGNVDAEDITTGTIDGLLVLEEGIPDPDPENIMMIHDVEADAGDIITIEVEIMNDEEFVGFNLDIPMPAGFEYVEGTAELFRGTDHQFAFNVIDGNVAKIIAFSLSNDEFSGNDGVIFSFDVVTPNTPGEYVMPIVDAIIGNIDAEDILTETIDGTVILAEVDPDPEYSLTLLVNPEGAGEVTGAGEYMEGQEVAVTASANTGYLFTDWTDADGNVVSAEPEFVFVMPAEDTVLTANFEIDEDPELENIIKILDITAMAGDVVTIEVEILNDEEFVGFNLDIPLPEGFEYVEGTAQLFREDDHMFVFNVIEETNLAKIIAFSISNAAFLGNDGVIFSFDVQTPNVPGEYPLVVENGIIGNVDAEDITTGTIDGMLTLEGEVEPENIIKILDIVADAGDIVTIEVEILNDEEFVGFNLDIPLPEGFEYVEGTAQLFREDDHMFVFNVIEETNLAKIIAFSISNAAFLGNDGVIFSFDVQTPNVPGEYPLVVENGIIGNVDAEDITTGTIDGLLILEGEVPGENIMKIHDVTADAGDIITIELEILNDEEFVGFNLDIPLPEGFEYVEGTAELFRTTDHQFVFNVIEATNTAKIIAFSITNDAFLGNDGVIFSFDVQTPYVPGEYTLAVVDGIIGNIDAQDILTGTIDGTVTLEGIPMFNLTLLADPQNGGVVSGEGTYPAGEEVLITATPSTGFEFVDWTDADGNMVSDEAEYIYNMPAEDVTLTANFMAVEYEVTVSINPAGAGTVTGEGFYNYDDRVTLVATANEGYEFVNWTDADGNVLETSTTYIFDMPANDVMINANFAAVQYELTLIANPQEGGTVTGEGAYNAGDQVEVDAIPNEGWAFINWTDEDGNLVSDDAFNVITMPAADLTLIANFEMVEYTLTLIANPEEGGTVTGEGAYNAGDQVEVDAIPNEGWAFINWTDEDGNLVSDDAFNVITMPAADLTLIANFEMVEYALTLIANPEEGGTVTGEGAYNAGEEVWADALPNEGWEFINWTDEDGNVVSDEEMYWFTMPAADLTLTANFGMIDYTLTLNAEPAEGGEVAGAGVYNYGDVVEINAIPNEGYEFINWTQNGNVISEDASFTFPMPSTDLTLTANFELLTYTLTFEVIDEDTGDPILDAIITLNEVDYAPGQYVFENLLPGKYDYIVSREDYLPTEGSVDIIDQNVTEVVELVFDDEDISVGDVDVLDLSIFPNPASSIMNIESNLMISSLRMIDMLGQVVYDTTVDDTRYEINVSSFRNGVYFIQVNTSTGISTHRVQIVN